MSYDVDDELRECMEWYDLHGKITYLNPPLLPKGMRTK